MVTPKSSLYRSQVLGLCGLSSSSLGKNSLTRVDQSALCRRAPKLMRHRWQRGQRTCCLLWMRCWTRSRTERPRILSADPAQRRQTMNHQANLKLVCPGGVKLLTALDSNMTFTSPSTTGPFCRLMTVALLPTSGNTYKPHGLGQSALGLKEAWHACSPKAYRAVFLFGANTLEHLLLLHNYFHLEVTAVTFTHTFAKKAREKHARQVHIFLTVTSHNREVFALAQLK